MIHLCLLFEPLLVILKTIIGFIFSMKFEILILILSKHPNDDFSFSIVFEDPQKGLWIISANNFWRENRKCWFALTVFSWFFINRVRGVKQWIVDREKFMQFWGKNKIFEFLWKFIKSLCEINYLHAFLITICYFREFFVTCSMYPFIIHFFFCFLFLLLRPHESRAAQSSNCLILFNWKL